MKRDLSEGGIRVPMIVRWPGKTPPGSTTSHVGYFGDLMATAAELSDAAWAGEADSISFVPTITGDDDSQKKHEYLYWEFYERGGKQAVRAGQWKAIRKPWKTGQTQLFDLSNDIGEAKDVAADHPDIVKGLEEMMTDAHVPHPNWQVR